MDLPDKLPLLGIELKLSSSSLVGVTWSATIGSMEVQIRTLRGQWWATSKYPDRSSGPLPNQAAALAALKELVLPGVRAQLDAERNLRIVEAALGD